MVTEARAYIQTDRPDLVEKLKAHDSGKSVLDTDDFGNFCLELNRTLKIRYSYLNSISLIMFGVKVRRSLSDMFKPDPHRN